MPVDLITSSAAGGCSVDLAAVMRRCDEKAQLEGFSALTEAERVVVLVSRASLAIELGGLSEFFDLWGYLAAETAAALETVGAIRASTALSAAMGKFSGGEPQSELDFQSACEVQHVLGSLGEFDTEFSRDQPDVVSRLCSFIEAHAAELSSHEPKAKPGATPNPARDIGSGGS
jgi:hypothetical protein